MASLPRIALAALAVLVVSRAAALDDDSTLPPMCASFCVGSCCYFSEPAKECNACVGEKFNCRPGAQCYVRCSVSILRPNGYDRALRASSLLLMTRSSHDCERSQTTGNRGQTIVVPGNGEAVCQDWCWDTPNCCGFSQPTDCAACNATNGCHPEAECYNTPRRDEL